MKQVLVIFLVSLVACNSNKPDKVTHFKSRTVDSSVWIAAYNTRTNLPVCVPVVKMVLDTVVLQPDPKDSSHNIKKRILDSVYIFTLKGDTIRGKDGKPAIDSTTKKPLIAHDTYLQIAPYLAIEVTKLIPKDTANKKP